MKPKVLVQQSQMLFDFEPEKEKATNLDKSTVCSLNNKKLVKRVYNKRPKKANLPKISFNIAVNRQYIIVATFEVMEVKEIKNNGKAK